jgi:hypothetical protein
VYAPQSCLDAGSQSRIDAIDNLSPAVALLLLLLCGDAGFALLHVIYVETDWLRGMAISLEAEGGVAETYQYVKEFWVALCMAFTFFTTRRPVYGSWALVFMFLLVDDAGKVHEQVGAWLGQRYHFAAPFGLRPDDIGELLVAGTVGLITLTLVGVAAWRGTAQCRRIARDMLCLIVALALLGVVVDMLHVIAYVRQSLTAQVLLIVEDGGEMVVMSGLMAYAFHVASHRGRTQFDLWSTLRTRRLAWDAAGSSGPAADGLKPDSPASRAPGTRRHEWPDDEDARRSA